MRILTLSATDRIGGAGIAAYRTHRALLEAGVDSRMLVWRKASPDATVFRLAGRLNRAGRLRRRLAAARHNRELRRHPRLPDASYWSLNSVNHAMANAINSFEADIVHLHWAGDNYLPLQQFARINAPIVWTLHDMWAFTGGCHYAGECTRYAAACGHCPQLIAPASDDISATLHRRKREAWAGLPLTIVCPSRWLADCARGSALLCDSRVEVIPNPIDTRVFKPLDQGMARTAFNLPRDKRLLLFGAVGGASDRRKGFGFLREALAGISRGADVELVVFGAEETEALDLALPAHQIGQLHDEVSLSLLYNACDAFVLPSLQDNLPNTLLEALACGVPGIAFDVGGVGDLARHKHNGYLAKAKDADDLRRGIDWVLSQPWSPQRIHRAIAEEFAPGIISQRLIQLYESLGAAA